MKKMDEIRWKIFDIIDIFFVDNTHSILKSEIEFDSGDIPYVTSSDFNNAVSSYILADNNIMDKGNVILIGGKTMAISYQEKDFVSNDSHNLMLKLKNEKYRIESIQLFLVSALRNSLAWKYQWSDSISKKAIQRDVIFLPVTLEDEPDWEYMKEYIENLEKKVSDSLLKLNNAKNTSKSGIDVSGWKDFHLYDKELFSIDSGTKLDRIKMDMGSEEISFVGRSNVHNGITAKVKKIEGLEPYKKGNLTLALGGAYLGSCFVQPDDFYTSQNVVVLIPNHDMSFNVKQFIASAIFVESQNNYQAFIKELNAHIKRNFTIKLPVTLHGVPDWDYMEQYMERLQKKIEQIIACFS